ncbi:unnamed protein product [Euphydryas editha]|uniref:Uncharacterized protein n=1 Tax=Euphydryas editha TaxID=104508 RepID=A0AAU9VBY4_EUPED|nr:unnamed protein product [Euphydryas editha]
MQQQVSPGCEPRQYKEANQSNPIVAFARTRPRAMPLTAAAGARRARRIASSAACAVGTTHDTPRDA